MGGARDDISLGSVVFRAPTMQREVETHLHEGEALLVGRSPEPARLPPGLLPQGFTLRALRLPASSVSSNHCLLWREKGRVEIRDLESRNGTMVPLGAGGSASMTIDGSFAVELAPVGQISAPIDAAAAPRDAQWERREDFAASVAREVSEWLATGGLPVRARVRRRAPGGAPGGAPGALAPIPLLDELALELDEGETAGTINPLWGKVIETIVSYVHAQRERLQREQRWAHGPEFVMASRSFRDAHQRVAEAASRGAQLILLGESGSGKGTLARCYHLHSPRAAAAFEAVNCAEMDKHFARTRLFGAKRGSYTGCHADTKGVIELAHRGTLFLDEVAELSLDVQGELLSFLDDQRYKRFGDESWLQADVAVVCGTNVDLRRAVRDGRFRADLWYRLAGRVVELPPLRERREDLVAFLKGASLGEGAAATSVWDALTEGARRLALEHPWRGNFRELAGFVRRLPAAVGDACLDEATARAALDEGALERSPRAQAVSESGWEAMTARAMALYRARAKLEEPQRSSDLRDFIEDALKPCFFARALGLEDIDVVPERPSPSFEEMARRMGCDASTVKLQLARYVEIRRGESGS